MKKQRLKYIAYSVSGFIVLILAVLGLAYGTKFNDPVTSTFKRTFPAKVVGSHIVSLYDLENAERVSRRIDNTTTRQQVADRLVRVELLRNVANDLNIDLNSDDVADELTYIKKGNEAEYGKLLNNYFDDSETLFTKLVAYPQAWEGLVRTKYNLDSTSSAAYIKAQDILRKLKNGEKFEELAKQYSDDKITGQLGGDLGFYEHGQILPELENEVSISALGQVVDRIIPSRLGYHVVYPVETSLQDGKKLWHIKHILIQNEGFDQWLAQKSNGLNVWNIK
jgi:parvulin-like peptidyl-prolyl isomerase